VNRKHIAGGVVVVAVLVGAGVGIEASASDAGGQAGAAYSGYGGTAGSGSAAVVGTAALGPGTVLVDGAGRALYLFDADPRGSSACTGGCAQVWPPLLTQDPTPSSTDQARSALLGTVQRGDGTEQVTYNGHPLYHYVGDTGAGTTRGQGLQQFGGGWYVLTPAGDEIDSD
jgi:predicted lipoprotein with Yx(FWY)xxD motif